jgi:hypothetical protein
VLAHRHLYGQKRNGQSWRLRAVIIPSLAPSVPPSSILDPIEMKNLEDRR